MAPQFTIRGDCKARPEAAYDLVANVQSHLEWNGERQAKNFRLLTLTAQPGAAVAGSTWESTGSTPMSSRRWYDRSTVTVAERPRVFEFRTEATAPFQNGERMEAVIVHRYEFEPKGGGTCVSYTMRQESMEHGMWRLTLPLLRPLMWRFGIPMMTRRGFNALLHMAEAAERQPSASAQPA